jgi:hypothetical protein
VLYHIAVEYCQSALAPFPIAKAQVLFVDEPLPIANEYVPLEVTSFPIAIDFSPLDNALYPRAIECNPTALLNCPPANEYPHNAELP